MGLPGKLAQAPVMLEEPFAGPLFAAEAVPMAAGKDAPPAARRFQFLGPRSKEPVLAKPEQEEDRVEEDESPGELDLSITRWHSNPDLTKLAAEGGGAAPPACEPSERALPRESPYVGSQRHAPPSSPKLCFSVVGEALQLKLLASARGVGSLTLLEFQQLPGRLPLETWSLALSYVAELRSLGCLARAARGFTEALRSEVTWCGRPVRVDPDLLPALAPNLAAWLPCWQSASKLVAPRSAQLLSEVAKRAPGLEVEVAWRFDTFLRGTGVEVLRSGGAVRRVAEEELVVLGDAPLPQAPGRAPYLEVLLEELEEVDQESELDCLNDLGIGVTACDPKELHEDFDQVVVADEVPRSWVVDFARSFVTLSVNNQEAARCTGAKASDLRQGGRVGVRAAPDGAIELFIDGVLRGRLLAARPQDRVPPGVDLFPVLDLYGRATLIARSDAEGPCSC